jgi:hypothetical protein
MNPLTDSQRYLLETAARAKSRVIRSINVLDERLGEMFAASGDTRQAERQRVRAAIATVRDAQEDARRTERDAAWIKAERRVMTRGIAA